MDDGNPLHEFMTGRRYSRLHKRDDRYLFFLKTAALLIAIPTALALWEVVKQIFKTGY